jgi:hypothetical protein
MRRREEEGGGGRKEEEKESGVNESMNERVKKGYKEHNRIQEEIDCLTD